MRSVRFFPSGSRVAPALSGSKFRRKELQTAPAAVALAFLSGLVEVARQAHGR